MKIAIRSKLRAAKGKKFLAVDLSQAEAWAVAYLAREPTMKQALIRGDIHTLTAISVNNLTVPEEHKADLISYSKILKKTIPDEQRYVGKKSNHSFNYLQTEYGAAAAINKEGIVTVSIKQTRGFRTKYIELYSGIESWWREVASEVRANKRLTTPYGFVRTFYQVPGTSLKCDLDREAVAFVPQSTIADHMYGDVQEELGIEGGLKCIVKNICTPCNIRFCDEPSHIHLVHSAHDSGILEFPQELDVKELWEDCKRYLERPMVINDEQFTIPADAKWGERWEEFEKVA